MHLYRCIYYSRLSGNHSFWTPKGAQRVEQEKEEHFYYRMLSKKEWNDPQRRKFTNAEIPGIDIEFGTRLDKIIKEGKLPETKQHSG